ncbi:MAG: DUF2795 domain-containing protein [Sphaerobacter sp.]|nr:DUF2795 domain-containing protein [Sphaerobacter sp.]
MHEQEPGQEHGHMMPSPAQVQKFLSGVDYPIDKNGLIARAREAGASQDVLSTLQRLPEKRFNSPTDVSEQIGKLM